MCVEQIPVKVEEVTDKQVMGESDTFFLALLETWMGSQIFNLKNSSSIVSRRTALGLDLIRSWGAADVVSVHWMILDLTGKPPFLETLIRIN